MGEPRGRYERERMSQSVGSKRVSKGFLPVQEFNESLARLSDGGTWRQPDQSLFISCEIERKNAPGSGSYADSWYYASELPA